MHPYLYLYIVPDVGGDEYQDHSIHSDLYLDQPWIVNRIRGRKEKDEKKGIEFDQTWCSLSVGYVMRNRDVFSREYGFPSSEMWY